MFTKLMDLRYSATTISNFQGSVVKILLKSCQCWVKVRQLEIISIMRCVGGMAVRAEWVMSWLKFELQLVKERVVAATEAG